MDDVKISSKHFGDERPRLEEGFIPNNNLFFPEDSDANKFLCGRKAEIMRKVRAYGILNDPQWLNKPDEPVPLWVLLEALVQMMERLEPPHTPYD
jgi:hypothetical protein